MKVSRLLSALLLCCAVTVIALELLARSPQAAPAPELALPAGISRLVLVVHGSQDSDNPQFPAIVERLAQGTGPDTIVRYVDWSPWSDLRLRAGATASRIGAGLGARLAAEQPGLGEVLLVMHSAGAWMGDALCEQLRVKALQPVRVDMVFLDAFQIRGFTDWSNGSRHHGRCADFALSLLNTDDPAPATNWPLRQAFNVDVTAHPGRAGFERNGHYWPVEYFLRFMTQAEWLQAEFSHEELPRGEMIMAPAGPPTLP
ncbi:MAG: hypothetical protein JJT85_11450 [Chromatiales bacterium]|nr:hypothetical protein [Chromatiales bacterium]